MHLLCCERFPRFCVLMNLTCRDRVSLGNLAGENFLVKNFLLGVRTSFPEQTGTKTVVRQFTNRRMRTFIATPSARKVNKTEDPP